MGKGSRKPTNQEVGGVRGTIRHTSGVEQLKPAQVTWGEGCCPELPQEPDHGAEGELGNSVRGGGGIQYLSVPTGPAVKNAGRQGRTKTSQSTE
jgi:hypothetical protein